MICVDNIKIEDKIPFEINISCEAIDGNNLYNNNALNKMPKNVKNHSNMRI